MERRDHGDSIQDQHIISDGTESLQRQEWMPRVIKDSRAEHKIEFTQYFRTDIVHIHALVADLAVLYPKCELKLLQRIVTVPTVPEIYGYYFGPPALQFQRKVSVPCSNVERTLAGQVFRYLQKPQPAGESSSRKPTGLCINTVSQVNW